ncbi:MAG: DUF2341 domain-containing protein [Proteobacteria bacterium]|nr:DUF2341 domain-containing protein [Pseudomonadota bacterium]
MRTKFNNIYSWIVIFITLAFLCTCTTETASSLHFELHTITPDTGISKDAVNVEIDARYFHLKATQQLESGGHLKIDRDFTVVLIPNDASRSPVSLQQVTYINERTLNAQVPEGVPTGIYDVEVTNPYGAAAVLPSAYTATECLVSGHCNGATPHCDTTAGRCVECLTDRDCSSSTPWCDPNAKNCVACLEDTHCRDANPCTTSEQCYGTMCNLGPNDKDADGDGFVDALCGGPDCDDNPAAAGCGAGCHPEAAEICDGLDNDCDPATGDGDEDPLFEDPCDGDDGDLCAEGIWECTAGTLVCSDTTGTDGEGPYTDATCVDSIDNDCDGATDAPDTDCAYTWFSEDWNYRRKIVFDNSEQTEEALIDFPVYIALDNSWFAFNHLLSGFGKDILFVAADDATKLPYEIEDWLPGNSGDLWVNVPRIEAGSTTDYIWMYYGDATATAPTNSEETWNSEYEAVYHFASEGDKGNPVEDSTSNHFDAVDDSAHHALGHIGNGREFDGFNDYIDLGPDRPLLMNVEACTLSAWIYPDRPTLLPEHYIISISVNNGGVPTANSRATLGLWNYNRILAGGRAPDSMEFVYTETPVVITGNTGQYIVAVLDYANDRIDLFRNGVLVPNIDAGIVDFTDSTTSNTPAASAHIGANDDGQSSFFDGIIDEVRISRTARSADWIKAQYLSMTDSFVLFGDEEQKSALP